LRLIVYSKDDPAGRNIASHLEKKLQFRQAALASAPALACGDIFLLGLSGRLVDLDVPFPDAEWLLCLSRHKSASGKQCLTAHTPGNLTGSADLGGRSREVAISNPPLQSLLIRGLQESKKKQGLETQVTLEATHHGPTSLSLPVTFIEIGSDEAAWEDEILGEAVAAAVQGAVTSPVPAGSNAIGVGGGHYPEKFTALVETGGCYVGHILPRYAMAGGMETAMVETCIKRTSGGCDSIYVDWKGTPSQFKDALRTVSQSLGVELVKV
jgi:D-aminoacyl-tRNA deacylase